MSRQLRSLHIRQGYPPFLDLPWNEPLMLWRDRVAGVVDLPRGLSRHDVVFCSHAEGVYAFKAIPARIGQREFANLVEMEALGLPAVTPVGLAHLTVGEDEQAILITRFLDGALPYRALFRQPGLERYRARLLDAMAGLLVRLHLAGCHWGDCSLSNTLFRRDAGELQAFLVDAETAELHTELSTGQREADLMIMEENLIGDLLDLTAEMGTAPGLEPEETVASIRERYLGLWSEITREVLIGHEEEFRIHERVRALNQRGFSVAGIELLAGAEGDQLRLRTIVTDRDYHRHQLHSLTGLVATEHQATLLFEEIQQLHAVLCRELARSAPLGMAAQRWLVDRYQPTVERLRTLMGPGTDLAELYCEILEHKWFLSEQAARDVGMEPAIDDYLRRFAGADASQPPGNRPAEAQPPT